MEKSRNEKISRNKMSKCYVIKKTAEEETNPTSAVFGLYGFFVMVRQGQSNRE